MDEVPWDVSDWPVRQDESMGDVNKLWLLDSEGHAWLFKANREGRSQDEGASEYAAAQIARLLHVPAAEVHLATRKAKIGALCRNLVTDPTHEFVEASSLLSGLVDDFDPRARNRVGHNFTNIQELLSEAHAPIGTEGTQSAIGVFGIYLLFDALIGNTDRHSGNWAFECSIEEPDCLLPSYDHATSLGITTRDERRQRILGGLVSIDSFVRKATAARFENGRTTTLVDFAIDFNEKFSPHNLPIWRERMRRLPLHEVSEILRSSGMSEDGAMLAMRVVETNRRRLMK